MNTSLARDHDLHERSDFRERLANDLVIRTLTVADEVLGGQQMVAHQESRAVGLVLAQSSKDRAVFVVGASHLLFVEFADRPAGNKGTVGERVDQRRKRAVVRALGDDTVESNVLADDRLVISNRV